MVWGTAQLPSAAIWYQNLEGRWRELGAKIEEALDRVNISEFYKIPNTIKKINLNNIVITWLIDKNGSKVVENEKIEELLAFYYTKIN